MSDSGSLDDVWRRMRSADAQPEPSLEDVRSMLAELNLLVEDLEVLTGVRWVIEREQDASFFASIAEMDRFRPDYDLNHPFALTLRVSLWGRLVGVVAAVPPGRAVLDSVQGVVSRQGYFLVPNQVLMDKYDGCEAYYGAVGNGLWFDRFFQYH